MRTLVIFIPSFVFLLLFVPSLAMAQSKPPPYRPPHAGEGRVGDPLRVAAQLGGAFAKPGPVRVATPEELWKKIQAANAADLRYAKALADSAGAPGARLRSACYGAWIATIEQA